MSTRPPDCIPAVTYVSEPPWPAYIKLVDNATNPDELRDALAEWVELAPDAYERALSLTNDDWPEFRRGLTLERNKQWAGQDWYDRFVAILLPLRMTKTTELYAAVKGAPWGTCFIRLREMGRLDG